MSTLFPYTTLFRSLCGCRRCRPGRANSRGGRIPPCQRGCGFYFDPGTRALCAGYARGAQSHLPCPLEIARYFGRFNRRHARRLSIELAKIHGLVFNVTLANGEVLRNVPMFDYLEED